jgi:hypothetical protein
VKLEREKKQVTFNPPSLGCKRIRIGVAVGIVQLALGLFNPKTLKNL